MKELIYAFYMLVGTYTGGSVVSADSVTGLRDIISRRPVCFFSIVLYICKILTLHTPNNYEKAFLHFRCYCINFDRL